MNLLMVASLSMLGMASAEEPHAAERFRRAQDSIYSGTSQATPHVAGAAALYLERNPSASVSQVTGALLNNTTPNVVANPGTGSPNRLLFSGFIP